MKCCYISIYMQIENGKSILRTLNRIFDTVRADVEIYIIYLNYHFKLINQQNMFTYSVTFKTTIISILL